MESRKIEGWRSRQEREVSALRSAWYSSGTTVEILEDGVMVSHDQFLNHYEGRKTKRCINRGREWDEFDAYRRKLRLAYICEWQRQFRLANPDAWKAQRSAIDKRSRVKNREKRVQYLRDRRSSMDEDIKAEAAQQQRIYAQLVKLAGLRKY
jgi:hypothetical protein